MGSSSASSSLSALTLALLSFMVVASTTITAVSAVGSDNRRATVLDGNSSLARNVQYPPGTVQYTRVPRTEVEVPFFTRCWYVGIILIVVAAALLYTVLCLWICCHFKYGEQRKAKKVVQKEYETNGFFDVSQFDASRGRGGQDGGDVYETRRGSGRAQSSEVQFGSDEDDTDVAMGDTAGGYNANPLRR